MKPNQTPSTRPPQDAIKLQEVEVTPEMAAAGAEVIQAYSGVVSAEYLAADVYRTMVRLADRPPPANVPNVEGEMSDAPT